MKLEIVDIVEALEVWYSQRSTKVERPIKKEGNYYAYKVAYTLRHLVVDVHVEYFYYESDSVELPSYIKELAESRRVALMSKYHCNVSIETTKVVTVSKKDYRLYQHGRCSIYIYYLLFIL